MDKTMSKSTIEKCIPIVESIEDLFENGMKRSFGPLETTILPTGGIINLGCGNFKLDKALMHSPRQFYDLQPPEWIAPFLNFGDSTIACIHAYHFLEHLEAADLKQMIRECNRVLKPGGVMNICVPYARSDIAFQDIDHKTFFTEESWETLIDNPYYDPMYDQESGRPPLELVVGANFIAGITGRNLAVFTQLTKRS